MCFMNIWSRGSQFDSGRSYLYLARGCEYRFELTYNSIGVNTNGFGVLGYKFGLVCGWFLKYSVISPNWKKGNLFTLHLYTIYDIICSFLGVDMSGLLQFNVRMQFIVRIWSGKNNLGNSVHSSFWNLLKVNRLSLFSLVGYLTQFL